MSPDEYNVREIAERRLTPAHITAMTRRVQTAAGLSPDGRCGPATRAVLDAPNENAPPPPVVGELIVRDGWLVGPGVDRVEADKSWYGWRRLGLRRFTMPTGRPLAIVAHYTATDGGTGPAMAKRRTRKRRSADRAASWHLTIERDGWVIQMVPLDCVAWHVAQGRLVDDKGKRWRPNHVAVGIELVGHGDSFTEPQVASSMAVWRALVQAYEIPRARAMLEHSQFQANRRDPGPVWMGKHAPRVLAHAFA